MKKEVIIAIFIGVFIGLVITFGLKRAEQSLSNQMESPQAKTISPALESPQAFDHTLYVASPQPNAIIDSAKITLSGSTTPYALIAAMTSHDQNNVMADMQGNFSLSLSLVAGANLVSVSSFDNQGQSANSSFPIVYTRNDFDKPAAVATPTAIPTNTPAINSLENSPDASPSSFDVIKDNVKRRIQDVVKDKGDNLISKEKVAYIGTLKSRTSNTLSIQTNTTIKLASVSASTSVERNPIAGSLTLDDIALDDYMVALGYIGDDEVLDALKIIIEKSTPTSSKYQLAYGKIVKYNPKDYNLTVEVLTDNSQKTFLLSRKAVIKQAYANDVVDTLLRTQALPIDAHVLIVYLPAETETDDTVAYQLLIKTNPINSKEVNLHDVTPTP